MSNAITVRIGSQRKTHLHGFAKGLQLISGGTFWILFEKILAGLYSKERLPKKTDAPQCQQRHLHHYAPKQAWTHLLLHRQALSQRSTLAATLLKDLKYFWV